ncbi:MAG: macrolide ABC transporter ATP-binding protein [delta proteobacterium ML8_F1]|nr:MAG: macrolide ABC transporter ATP-binding protein [delta proteobacterium ML8_F1]
MKDFIEVRNISKTYQMGEITVNALTEVGFSVGKGEFVVILGPSGSGKSTLLNLIGGMDFPSCGQIFVDAREVTAYNEQSLTDYRRHDIGFVFQFYNLMANLTARENIELATQITFEPLSVDEVLEDVALSHRKDHFPSQLSGGEQQRVAIARAVAKNPKVLLCDEPTGALDYATGVTILKLLRKINRKYNKTILIITHNAAIGNIGDRVIRLRSGTVTHNEKNPNPVEPERIEW